MRTTVVVPAPRPCSVPTGGGCAFPFFPLSRRRFWKTAVAPSSDASLSLKKKRAVRVKKKTKRSFERRLVEPRVAVAGLPLRRAGPLASRIHEV